MKMTPLTTPPTLAEKIVGMEEWDTDHVENEFEFTMNKYKVTSYIGLYGVVQRYTVY